jgi:hypothetical protein
MLITADDVQVCWMISLWLQNAINAKVQLLNMAE